MPLTSAESLRFDIRGLRIVDTGSALREWVSGADDHIALHFFDKPPDIAASLSDITGIRHFYRERAVAAGSGLVEAEVLRVAGCAAIRIIVKTPQAAGGMNYLASLTLPFRDFSYVIKVSCLARGIAGTREAVVLNQALAGGEVTLSPQGVAQGWARDPYGDPGLHPVLWNLSDAQRHDVRFPDHALSRARALLARIEATARLDDTARRAAPFVYRGGRAWWKFW